jgi:hypothetical protein
MQHFARFDMVAGEDGVLIPDFAFHRAGLRAAFDWAVELDPDLPDPGESKSLRPSEGKSRSLRPRQALIPIPILEARVPRLASPLHPLKEALESLVQAPEGVLEDLGMDPGALGTELLDLGKLTGLIGVLDAHALLPRLTAFFERGVIELLAEMLPLAQLPLLSTGRIEAILEGTSHSLGHTRRSRQDGTQVRLKPGVLQIHKG